MQPELRRFTIDRVVVETDGVEFSAAQRFGEHLGRALPPELRSLNAVRAADLHQVAQAVTASVQRAASEIFSPP
jgi:hypothetical protein